MKLAFIDNLPVAGGLSRFSLLLCRGLVENYPQLSVDYFIHHSNLKGMPEINGIERVNVIVIKSSGPASLPARLTAKVKSVLGKKRADPNEMVLQEIEQKADTQYDLAYFPSAHMMRMPNLPIPVCGTIHDFNWKYFFGQQIFPLDFVEKMDVEILKWMSSGFNICSSHDVVDEAKKIISAGKIFSYGGADRACGGG